MARIYCSNCGSEVVLPETSTLGVGITISKQSNGNFALPLETIKNNNLNTTKLNNKENKNMNSRENRMATLNNAGVDVSKFFDVTLPNGDVVKMTMENGIPVVVPRVPEAFEAMQRFKEEMQDEILNQIIEDGYVRNTKLHRRWIMAQMFKMLNYVSYNGRERGYDACLRNNYGYMYQFSMMLEEVRVLSKLEDRDMESFNERSHFFTKEVVVATCNDYLEKLKADIDAQKSKNCKGIPYKRVKGQNIFVDDLHKKVYSPIRRKIWSIERSRNYKEIYRELKKFNDSMIKLPWDTKKCKVWVDAYKGSGATYTLYNLVKFHDCGVYTADGILRGTDAVKYISDRISDYQGEYWRMMALLKKVIADNKFDFNKRMKEIYETN